MASEGNKILPDDEAAQRSAADSLQRQIDAIVKGQKPARASTPSLRDVVNEKMAEDGESEKKE